MVNHTVEVVGTDPIDSRLGGGDADQRANWAWHRPALGLAASPVPAFAALLVGVALGAQGLGVLTSGVLDAVAPVTVAATVVLGVLIGLDADVPRRLGGAAAIEAGLTLLAVAAGFTIVGRIPGWEWAAAPYGPLLLGICAASSATRARTGADGAAFNRLGDLDDLLPIAAGAVLLAHAAGQSGGRSLVLLAVTIALTGALAVASWLLLSRPMGEGEHRVYATGSVLLLTGLAASLAASTLFVGAFAAVAWRFSPVAGREPLAHDLRFLQHPIVVFLLVVAGAEARTSTPVLVLAAMFALVRLAGKLAGGALAAQLVPDVDRRLGFHLLAPGVAGIAAVLMALHGTVLASGLEALLGIVVWGTIVADLLALLVAPRQVEA